MHRSIRVSRKWLVLLAALAGLSGCSGDADAAEAAAASVEAAPTVTVASPTVTVSAPTATAVPAEPTEQPTEAPQRPTPQVVDDMALILQELTPNVGHLDYPDSGAVQSAFEADMLYTIVEYLNASMAATEAGVQLGEIPSFVRLAESGRINADLAAELSPSTTELAVFSDESILRSLCDAPLIPRNSGPRNLCARCDLFPRFTRSSSDHRSQLQSGWIRPGDL